MFKNLFGANRFPAALLLIFFLGCLDGQGSPQGLVSGPDVIAGDMDDLSPYGSDGSAVGLGIGTDICNAGNQEVDFMPMPSTHHPVIAQNLYRMGSGANNDERFEQVGQSWVKHTFGSGNGDDCNFGCISTDGYHLGRGCSDAYLSSQNAGQEDLGSRAWINPFTGLFSSDARDHTGHVHTNTSHRILVENSDLISGLHYFAEIQYITPDEYAWCQAHPGECNMSNNVSYRPFEFTPVFVSAGPTVQMSPAINAWPGATVVPIEPAAGMDGRAYLAFKVTSPSSGVWHYEYAIYNMNLDRAIQSFALPIGGTITVSNVGFHAPLNHPGFAHDGTEGDAGYSNAAWTANQAANSLSWSTETFAQNQNANAIRWGTLYNFRFDSNRPPHATNATIGFFKMGNPVTVGIQGPDPSNATPAPTATPVPATPTPHPTATPTPGGSPSHPVNLSTRMFVGVDDNVGIGGFVIRLSSAPHHHSITIVRALGPSLAQAGVPNALSDPILELQGSGLSSPIVNDNWRDDTWAEEVEYEGLAPFSELESALWVRLDQGAYTVTVRGKNNSSGIALVEIYDLSGDVANLSTRALVGAADDILIAGVTVVPVYNNIGTGKIVVRGIGPSFGLGILENALPNPKLELRDVNGSLLMANDNWQDDPAQAAEMAAVHLFLASPLESALVTTLWPGTYTALLSDVNQQTGIGLIEVYDICGTSSCQ